MAPQRITSRQNPHVKLAARLRDRRGRDTQQRMIIDGRREIQRALAAGLAIVELYYCPGHIDPAEVRRMEESAGPIEVFEVTREVFDKIAYGDRHDGVVAVAHCPSTAIEALQLGPAPLVVVLEAVEKPGNVGAVLRTAAAAGADALVLADPATDPFNPNCIRASLGAIFHVPVAAGTSAAARQWFAARDFRILAARVDGSIPYDRADYTGPTAVILGSESDGLSHSWTGPSVMPVTIPMQPATVDSLNVSATAAIILYEARRQRLA